MVLGSRNTQVNETGTRVCILTWAGLLYRGKATRQEEMSIFEEIHRIL